MEENTIASAGTEISYAHMDSGYLKEQRERAELFIMIYRKRM